MKAVVQRVADAEVTVADETVGKKSVEGFLYCLA